MELIIDFDSIDDTSKKEFLLDTLKFLKVEFKAFERPPTLVEFDYVLERTDTGNADPDVQ